MKIWDEFKYIDEEERLFTIFSWSSDKDIDIRITVEGYEHMEDEIDLEPKGEIFHEIYTCDKAIEALKKFVELIDKDFEVVSLTFASFGDIATFTFRVSRYGVVVTFSADKERLVGECAKKLAEIRRIIGEIRS